MNATSDNLREDLKDPEIAEGYAESFLDSYIATQIKVLREQNKLSQAQLAEMIGTKQGAISRIEDVNYSKWNVTTLKKLARAFRLRLKVSFETYGTLIDEVENFSRQGLERSPRESDPILLSDRATNHGHSPWKPV
jgi:transcriptional regulator with XRE-family HTH domain